MKKYLYLATLSVLLAACGGVNLGNTPKVTVSTSSPSVNVDPSGTTSTTSEYSFTNAAGAIGGTVTTAQLNFIGTNIAPVTVPLGNLVIPAGNTCANAIKDATYSCGVQEATDFVNRTIAYAIKDATLFSKVTQANPAAKSYPVSVTFNGNSVGGSWSSNPVTVQVEVGGQTANPTAPQPVLVVNNTEAQPYKNILSVTVSAGLQGGQTIGKTILVVTDSRNIVDSTTFTSTAETATFSVDTSKYPDGNLTLKAVAFTSDNLKGESAARTVQIQNLVAPTLQIVSPAQGDTVSNTLNASIQLTKQNTDFSIVGSAGGGANTVTLSIRDYRGDILDSKVVTFVSSNTNMYTASASFDMNSALYPNNTYTLVASTRVQLTGEPSPRTIVRESAFSTLNSNSRPPALIMHLPTTMGGNVTPIIGRYGGAFIQATDDKSVKQLQVQFTCIAADCSGSGSYSYNYALDTGVAFRFVDLGMIIDGIPFVKDGQYMLRMTVTDSDGLTSIQEAPIVVSRAAAHETIAGFSNIVDVVTYENAASKLTPASAVWSLAGTSTNAVRVVTMVYSVATETIGVSAPTEMSVTYLPAGSTISTGVSFAAKGRHQVTYLVEDLVTGIVHHYVGPIITVMEK